MQIRQASAERFASVQQSLRARHASEAEAARVREVQGVRWAAGHWAEEQAAEAWRLKLHQREATQKRREAATAQREARAATRRANALQQRARRVEAQLLKSHDVNDDGVLDTAEFGRLQKEVEGDGRVDQRDFLRLARSTRP